MTETTVPIGVIAPNLTPFNDDGSIAIDLYTAHAKRLLDTGCVAIAPFGTTGEALSVGIDERIATLDAMIADGIDPARLIPGTGLTSIADTARLSKACLERGCAGIMVLPPFYFKSVPDAGLTAYFSTLINEIGHETPNIYLYHIPHVAGVGIPVNVVRELRASFPAQIVGIKDSSGNWENTSALLDIEGLIVYPGSEIPLMEALERGAPGCITATANINTSILADAISSYAAGDIQKARDKHAAVIPFRKLVTEFGPIPSQKYLLSILTGDRRWCNLRPPLMALDEAAAPKFIERVKSDQGLSILPD